MAKNMILPSATPSSSAFTLNLVDRDAHGVDVHYTTFSANSPAQFGNTLMAFEVDDVGQIPWTKDPVASARIESDDYRGIQRLDFTFAVKTNYVIGYGLTPDVGSICASLYVPANKDDETETDKITLEFVSVGSDFVQVKYNALDGYHPNQYQNWVGLWNSDNVTYAGDQVAKANVTSALSKNGTATIRGYTIAIQQVYAVGYFTAPLEPGKTALAAFTTFTT